MSGSPDQGDDGFTLIETVIAMVVFTIFASAVLGLVVQAQGLNADSTRRNGATGLASSAIESVRSLDLNATPDPLPFGTTVTTPQVGGITYTVTRVVAPATAAANTSVCAAGTGGSVAYKRVSVTVTWPNRRNVTQPVRADTLRAVGFGTDNAVSGGSTAVSVTGPDGPVAGIDVTMTSTSPAQMVTATSGSDGCAVFTGLTGTAYSVTANTAGYTGINGAAMSQPVSTSVTGLSDGVLARATLPYATSRSITVGLNPPAGVTWPTALQLSATGTLGGVVNATPACVGANPTVACLTAVPGTFKGLYPDTYTVQAGSCPGTTLAPTSSAQVAATGTAVPSTTLDLGSVDARVLTLVGNSPVSGRTVTFTRQAQSGETCTGSEVYTATTGAAGTVSVALPYGRWRVTTTSNTVLGGMILSATATPTSGARTQPANFLVAS